LLFEIVIKGVFLRTRAFLFIFFMPTPKTDWLLSAPVTATSEKAETPIFAFLARLMRGEDLPAKDAAQFFRSLIDPNIGSNQVSAALTALTAKGETHEELAGMAEVMRAVAINIKSPKNAIDIAGTGSSHAKTFNVSTAASA